MYMLIADNILFNHENYLCEPHVPGAGEGFMPSLEKCPNRCGKNTDLKYHRFGKSVEHCFRKGIKPFPALAPLPLVKLLTYIFAH